MTKVLMHAREAGIATIFSNLIPIFRKHGWKVDLDFNAVSTKCLDTSLSNTNGVCDILLCGYDNINNDETREILRWAKKEKILTIGILDAWKGLDRFWKNNGTVREMADFLLVPDLIIADWLIKRGMDASTIRIIQHPVIEKLQSTSEKQRLHIRNSVESRFNICNKNILMFFSEPIYKYTHKRDSYGSLSQVKMKNQEKSSLLNWLTDKYSDKYCLFMRKHPVEADYDNDLWLNGNNLSIEEALFSPKIIIGVGSTMLRYAAALNLPVKNVSDEIQWTPEQSNYDNKIWRTVVSQGLFGHNQEKQHKDEAPSVFDQIILLIK